MSGRMLLAFDTSSAAVTAALYEGTSVLAEHTSVDPLRHGELLAPAISAALKQGGVTARDLTEIAVGVGPGPFTGLRVGVVTARTMASVLGVPVVGVCSLDVVAAAVTVNEPFLVATDARRREVYWARYAAPGAGVQADPGGGLQTAADDGRSHAVVRLSGPAVSAPASVVATLPEATKMPVAGRGAMLYPETLRRAVAPEYPSAADLARVVADRRVHLLPVEPLYLRRPSVARPAARKSVL